MTQLVSVRSFLLVDGKRILPEGVIYIGRAVPRVGLKASPWANPYRPAKPPVGASEWFAGFIERQHITQYRHWLHDHLRTDPRFIDPLRDATLVCWCQPPEPCHGRVILEAIEIYPRLPRPDERVEFGKHRMPGPDAEEAPAWPSLASVRAAADAKFRREQRKVRV